MAEPAYNAGGLIDFDDTGGGNTSTNYTLPGSPQEPQGPPPAPPTQLPTNDTNVTAVSNPPNTTPNTILNNLAPIEDEVGEIIYVKISDFNQKGTITLVGNYSQNFVDLPKYDLSPIRILSGINFEFLLAIKETKTSPESVFYTSKRFYIKLLNLYAKNQPYLPNYMIKQERVVVVVLDGIKELINDLHIKELKTFLSKEPTIVMKNVFEFSNYGPEPDFEINSTYDLDELVRYIDWVVSKPSPNYNERLLAENVIGEWNSRVNDDDVIVEADDNGNAGEDEPPTNNDTPEQFPPIGRRGSYVGEIVESNFGVEFIWNGTIWSVFQGGGGPSGGGS